LPASTLTARWWAPRAGQSLRAQQVGWSSQYFQQQWFAEEVLVGMESGTELRAPQVGRNLCLVQQGFVVASALEGTKSGAEFARTARACCAAANWWFSQQVAARPSAQQCSIGIHFTCLHSPCRRLEVVQPAGARQAARAAPGGLPAAHHQASLHCLLGKCLLCDAVEQVAGQISWIGALIC